MKLLVCLFGLALLVPQGAASQHEVSVDSRIEHINVLIDSLGYYADGFPPNVTDSAEQAAVTESYRSILSELESLTDTDESNPQLHFLLGKVHRMGHNLDAPDAWEKAEEHLEEAIDLDENFAEAYFLLGLLYVNTHPKYAAKAEDLFLEAIEHSGDSLNPYYYNGLTFALMYQRKYESALKAINNFLELVPNETSGIALRNFLTKRVQR